MISLAQRLRAPQFERDVFLARGKEVLSLEAAAIVQLGEALDENFAAACTRILDTPGRVMLTGMGKSGLIARKIAATLAATGTPASFVHPAEAAHGDMGMVTTGDTLLVLSNSGATSELRAIVGYAQAIGVPIIGVASRAASFVISNADIGIVIPPCREACAANVAPTTSTTMQLALGDAIAMAVMDARGFSRDNLRTLHPGGAIGLRLAPVADFMHRSGNLPIVRPDAAIKDAILVMTSCGFGMAGVIGDDGRLAGVITDGDLRRHFEDIGTATAGDIMTRDPKTLFANMPAEDALIFLTDQHITAAFVFAVGASSADGPIGLVHIHDFLRFGLN